MLQCPASRPPLDGQYALYLHTESAPLEQREVAGCSRRPLPVVRLKGPEVGPADPGYGNALEYGKFDRVAAASAVEEQPHVDKLAVRVDTELVATTEPLPTTAESAVLQYADRPRSGFNGPDQFVCRRIAFGSHGGALALVAGPEETPQIGVDRRFIAVSGLGAARLAAVQKSARRRDARRRNGSRTSPKPPAGLTALTSSAAHKGRNAPLGRLLNRVSPGAQGRRRACKEGTLVGSEVRLRRRATRDQA